MSEKSGGETFFVLSCVVVGYFSFLFINAYVLKSNFFLISVIAEIITIPMMLLQFVIFILSIFNMIKDKFQGENTYSFWSFLILLISNVIILLLGNGITILRRLFEG